MRTAMAVLAAASVLALCAPAPAAAQEPAAPFEQLRARLDPLDTIWVTDAQGRRVKGTLREVGPASLTIWEQGSRVFDAADVRLIAKRGPKSVGRSALRGALAGAAAGAIVSAVGFAGDDYYAEPLGGTAVVLIGTAAFGVAGAGLGALLGALSPGPAIVVYRAPARPGGAKTQVSLAPLLAPRAGGAAVSIAF